MSETLTPQRYHDLDAVRAVALTLGVVLHATMSFIEPQIWLVKDVSHSTSMALLFYVIHMFRMLNFFVMAGFFAHMMVEKRGVWGFATNRLKRLAIPLVAFWPIVMAAIIAVMIFASMPPAGTPAPPPPPTPAFNIHTFPLTHLWFLYVLLILCAGAIVLKLIVDLLKIGEPLGRLFDSLVGGLIKIDMIIAVLLLPAGLVTYFNPSVLLWFGIPTPDTGLIPNATAVAGFTTAFVFGWCLHRRADLLAHIASRCWLYLFSAVVGTIICLVLVGTTPAVIPVNGHDHQFYILMYGVSAWSWVMAFIGLAHRFIKREIPVMRLLSDSSYWVYIIHLPVLLLLQLFVKDVALPAEIKCLLVICGTMAIGLVSYQFMVRYS
ncbi:MAG: acyltransferase family protein, partial [Asticcacaulis sp.]